MINQQYYHDVNSAWTTIVEKILVEGNTVAPRGMKTREILHASAAVSLRNPILISDVRKPYYRFMGGEALWMIDGDDTVAGIAPYNKHIADYSDDGEKFFGAYGPKLAGQREYVVDKLVADPDTRQAVISIWRENPPATKDVPCTLIWSFSIRDGFLNCHAVMRSNDLWLGFPYDIFNFSLIATEICCRVNHARAMRDGNYRRPIRLGHLFWTAFSAHLYEQHWDLAHDAVTEQQAGTARAKAQHPDLVATPGAWPVIRARVEKARDANRPVVWPAPHEIVD